MRAFVGVLLVAIALVGCGNEPEKAPRGSAPVGDPGIVHVHGLGRNPADGSLMIATHTGLFRAGAEGGKPERVAGRFQDTMGFTVVGPDHFLGSGHPASVDDPAFLGLIESRDAGNNWRPISLRGEVDFHVLESQGDVRVRERFRDSRSTLSRERGRGRLMGAPVAAGGAHRLGDRPAGRSADRRLG
jgi:hypothetical protein